MDRRRIDSQLVGSQWIRNRSEQNAGVRKGGPGLSKDVAHVYDHEYDARAGKHHKCRGGEPIVCALEELGCTGPDLNIPLVRQICCTDLQVVVDLEQEEKSQRI